MRDDWRERIDEAMRDRIEMQRKAFVEGAQHVAAVLGGPTLADARGALEADAAVRYPMTKRVPRRHTLSNGSCYSAKDGVLMVQPKACIRPVPAHMHRSDLHALLAILEEPTMEVPI